MDNPKKKLLLLTIPILAAIIGSYWLLPGVYDNSKLSASLPRDYQFTLNQSSQFIMLSLFPMSTLEEGTDLEFKNHEKFHNYPVLGKFQVKDQKLKEQLLAAFYKGVEDGDKEEAAACFNPRHGIRAQHNGKTVDLVICFECHQFEMYPQRKRGYDRYVPITNSPQDTFDRALRSANVPLGHRD